MIKRICLFVIVIECLLVVYVMGKGFETNLENLKGVESSWEVTDKGLKDGSEQTVYDFCVSDTSVDGRTTMWSLRRKAVTELEYF